MPRTRARGKASSKAMSYREDTDSSSDEQSSALLNLVGVLLNFHNRTQRKSKRQTPKKGRKRKTTGPCFENSPAKLQNTQASKSQSKSKADKTKPCTQTSAALEDSLALESDDEALCTKIAVSQEDTIKNKVDSFFNALDSDEEEMESKLNIPKKPTIPTEAKSKTFYTLSDSDEDEAKTNKVDEEDVEPVEHESVKAGSSRNTVNSEGLLNGLGSGLKAVSDTLNNRASLEKSEDLFEFVDNILNDCNSVDLTKESFKENDKVESLEDLQKKTAEILGGVSSLIDTFKPKEVQKKTEDSPNSKQPSCPVCLETLDASRKAMVTHCGHIFCEPCISQVAKTIKKCPSCRKNVSKTKYHAVYI